MAGVRVDIDIETIPPEVLEAVEKNSEAIADMVAAKAKNTTSFKDKTGKLRSKIRKAKKHGRWVTEAAAPHAFLVEYGHAGPNPAPPHAFLRPAMYDVIKEVKD